MAFRVVNLGDIHFESDQDWAADKGASVARAIGAASEGIDAIVVLFNGDFVYSGGTPQFEVATKFLNNLHERLVSDFPALSVKIICTPGNHDCDFSGDQEAREIVLEKVTANSPSSSIQRIVLEPLSNYFEFLSDNSSIVEGIQAESPFVKTTKIQVNDAEIEVVVLNSSWMSEKHEKLGSLTFPIDVLPKLQKEVPRVICFHHPPNWFRQPDTMRDLIRWIVDFGTICCTGHEHVAATSLRLDDRMKGVIYQEGGVFQANPSDSTGAFQVFDIDTEVKSVVLRDFRWEQDHFGLSSEPSEIDYGRLVAGTSRTRLKEEFLGKLDEPNFPGKFGINSLRLSEFFVFPDVLEVSEFDEKPKRQISGGNLVEFVNENDSVMFTGPERCGKTSLSKQLILELHSKGKIPVLLNAKGLAAALRKGRGIEKVIRKALLNQYQELTLEMISESYRRDSACVVDDFEGIFEVGVSVEAVTNSLSEFFESKLLIASSEFAVLESQCNLGNQITLTGFKRLQICDLGHERIKELATKFLEAEASENSNETRNVDDIVDIVTQVLKADFIPHHPWIVLVLIYKSTSEDSVAVSDGSYGHLYQAILTSAMSVEAKSGLDLNGKFKFLSLFSYELFSKEFPSIPMAEFSQFHKKYCEDHDVDEVDIPLNGVLDGLQKCGILLVTEEGVSFAAKYSFCFFLAWHFKSNSQNENTRQLVEKLVDQLYHRESANVLLFLSHLTSETWVLDLILDKSSELFKDAPLWNLDDDIQPILRMSQSLPAPELPASLPQQNKTDEMAAADSRRREATAPADFDGRNLEVTPARQDVLELENELHSVQSAFRMIGILGQVLKNNVNSAEASAKQKIVDEVFRLSRRMLGSGFEELANELPERRAQALEHFKNVSEESGHDRNKLVRKADREVVGVTWLATFSLVRSVAAAVGAPGLHKTYQRVVDEDNSYPNRLFQMTMLMENHAEFPKQKIKHLSKDLCKNWFGHSLLASLVTYHFYLYDRSYRLRQSMVELLGIEDKSKGQSKKDKRRGPPRITNQKPRKR